MSRHLVFLGSAFVFALFAHLAVRGNDLLEIMVLAAFIWLTMEGFSFYLRLRSAIYHNQMDSYHKKELGKLLDDR